MCWDEKVFCRVIYMDECVFAVFSIFLVGSFFLSEGCVGGGLIIGVMLYNYCVQYCSFSFVTAVRLFLSVVPCFWFSCSVSLRCILVSVFNVSALMFCGHFFLLFLILGV